MKNQVIPVETFMFKRLVVREGELWLSTKDTNELAAIEAGIRKTGLSATGLIIPLASISELAFNEASDVVRIRYRDDKGKDKSTKLTFADEEVANLVGRYLGQTLGLTVQEKAEGQTKPLLLNALYLVIAVVVTFLLATMEDSSELSEGGSRRGRGGRAILRLLYDTIGPTGITIIGTLTCAYLAYQMYDRYKNPATEVVYRR